MAGGSVITSSLWLQVFLYFHSYLLWVYYISATITFIFKDVKFPFPRSILGWECSALIFLFAIDVSRLVLASKGNKTRQRSPLAVSLVLSLPVILGNVFFLEWQTYILRLDQIFNIFSLAFVSIEFVLGVWTFLTLAKQRVPL